MIASGRIAQLVILVGMWATVLAFLQLARKGRVSRIRPLAALQAIEQAVGRAVEMGRPVHFVPGIEGLSGTFAAQTVAGLSVLAYTASLCAKYGCKIITTNQNVESLPVQQEIVKQAYLSAGKADLFDQSMVRHLSPYNMSYGAGAVALVERENVAANILIGAHSMEALMILEAGSRVGAMQIGGTGTLTRSMDFAVGVDYLLIGEDIYAAGAYLSGDRTLMATIEAQDYCKIGFLMITAVGVVLALLGNTYVIRILGS
jgi:hypothetical protein